jgi:serine/threonine protein kinase
VVRQLSSAIGELVVKSPHPNAFLAAFGRRAIRREAGVYARLDDIAGIPRTFGLAGGEHLVLEHVAGPTLRQAVTGLEDAERFFARLLETIRAMHRAGVAHGDLKRKENLLVGPGETPYIIDFGIAALRRESDSGVNRKRFEITQQADLNAWIKLKYGSHLDRMSPTEAALYRPLLLERWARRLRTPWKLLTFRRLRKRRRAERQNRG